MQLIRNKFYQKKEQKFFKKHPNLLDKYANILKKLGSNPSEQILRLHKLQGKLKDFHAVSLNYEYRIILLINILDDRIVLVDIGTHDEVYLGKSSTTT
ncbi:MAG: type II toxin-antitoxin system mRNA interferase toxin, RelE/StbE family [Candidatus Marithrix sp.]|nr:type II toxin-antitoxin system mRNA interferase toxin, RelE/StbE family [Candidatus Marithrix sp.]